MLSYNGYAATASLVCLISLLLPYTDSSTPTTTNETDHLALVSIKSQVHDIEAQGVTNSWNSSVSLCLWRGVTCGRRHQRVIELDLSNQNIRGTLSPYIGNLTFLRSINLEANSFYGQIPPEIGRLYRLQTLKLSNNSFSGAIPTNLSHCSNLIEIFAFSNKLVGAIPEEIGLLAKLETITVADNHLTGELPASFGNLSALHIFNIEGNSLGGSIPDTLGQLKSLTFLAAGENNFSGTLPSSIYNISSLEWVYLLENKFHGSLPFNLGFTLPNLRVFVVSRNNFTGSIPDSFSNVSNLVALYLSENHFSGKVSIDFSGLKNLARLHLGINNLGTGTANDLDFVTPLTNCSRLDQIALYHNQFGGLLPHSIANFSTTVTAIWMQYNQISGTIPHGIRHLVNLTLIHMGFNLLTGTIPDAIGELKSLQSLTLYGNNLRGEIPISLGNLTKLTQLQLGINDLHGGIPSSLGNCQNLLLLSFALNKLTGIVPQQILDITTLAHFLDLSDNLLSGSFPSQVGNLKNLIYLAIAGNRFSGEIPVTLAGCTSLEHLKMRGNAFSGSIPPSLSSLKSIKEIDLSGNNLSGQIPEFLGNLSYLEYLNLSYNHFEGEVPTKGVFSSLTNFSLTGNEKLCGGLEELHLPPCPSKGSKKPTHSLLKVVIPVMVSCLIILACVIIAFIRKRKFPPKSSSMVQIEEKFPLISYAELSKATNEFSLSNMVGHGRYGFVYKGVLGENGLLVAVKVLNLEQKGAFKSFMSECEALRNIRHRNLIKIYTICSSIDFRGNDFKALVYEYMQNGSLEEWLYPRDDQTNVCNLSLIQRLNIVIDVASAVEYLHRHCQPPIIHGDLKPSNILLDDEMVAHVGDFGLARVLSDGQLCTRDTQSSSTGIKGTVGYVPPEYGMGTEVSMPGDVYSFGILLLELFTGRRPTDGMFNNGLTLHEFAKMAWPDKVMEIVEPSLLLEVRAGNFDTDGDERAKTEECLISIVRIGVLCSPESPTDRMEMTDALAKLYAARKKFLDDRI